METDNTEAAGQPPVLFGRSGKKRKAYRQRTNAVEDDTVQTDQKGTGDAPEADARDGGSVRNDGDDQMQDAPPRNKSDDDDDDGGDGDVGAKDEDDQVGIAVAELIRQRKARTRRQKLGGVEFRDSDSGPRAVLPSERSLVPRRPDDEHYAGGDDDDDDMLANEPLPMGIRFAPQTGIVGEAVNKHMEAYVEEQMSKRYKAEALLRGTQAQQPQQLPRSDRAAAAAAKDGPATGDAKGSEASREQLAMKGKLHEVDLGTEARARNIAMTERAAAAAMAAGDAPLAASAAAAAESSEQGDRGGRRSGRDGKPRDRQRRGSDDVKRDQLVEEFLRENPMDVDVYDVAREPALPVQEGRPTDDKIAEQFRREFMEAMAQRMRRKRRPLGPPAKPKTRNEEEILRGPKLGGSRNVRSVMRDKLLQKQEEQRQSMPKYEQQLQEERRRAMRRR